MKKPIIRHVTSLRNFLFPFLNYKPINLNFVFILLSNLNPKASNVRMRKKCSISHIYMSCFTVSRWMIHWIELISTKYVWQSQTALSVLYLYKWKFTSKYCHVYEWMFIVHRINIIFVVGLLFCPQINGKNIYFFTGGNFSINIDFNLIRRH